MERINVKKIAALAAGTLMLGASVAFADVVYSSTQLVQQNGQPVVKVAVGQYAAASDGVVAANIAAAIANNAYKSSTLTASPAGHATCAAGNATGGAGTCAISNEKAILEVTVPGVSVGAHEFSTLIGDYVDKKLQNRNNAGAADVYACTTSEVTDDANPYANGLNACFDPGTDELYRIGGDVFSPFAEATLSDTQTGDSYTETQAFWVSGTTDFSTTDNEVVGELKEFTYSAKFVQDNYGIPICTDPASGTTDYGTCANTATERTANHRLKIKFLGEDWIISAMNAPTTTTTNANEVGTGGSITLAKEAAYGIINVGDVLTSGDIKVRLVDISVATGATNVHPAIVDIIDAATGTVISQDQINSGDTLKKTIGGKTYRIHVYQTAPGFTLAAKWAEMALYSEEFDLTDGDTVDDDKNQDFNVVLGWKNRGASVSATNDNGDFDHLRTIVLYRDSFTEDKLAKGDSTLFLEDPATYTLEFNGLDLATSDYDKLSGAITEKTFRTDSTNTSYKCDDAWVVEMKTGEDFTTTGATGNTAYLVLDNKTAGFNCPDGAVFVKNDNYYVSAGNTHTTPGTPLDLEYTTAGSIGSWAAGGLLSFDFNASGNDEYDIYLVEDAGEAGGVADVSDLFAFDVQKETGDWTFQPTAGTTPIWCAADKVLYGAAGPLYTNGCKDEDDSFISERGTVFEDESATKFDMSVATKIGKAQYTLKTGTSETSADTTTVTLGEGESTTIGDVTVKVKEITETVGACTAAGGEVACTLNEAGVSAVIMPNNAPSVEVSEPFKLTSSMVMLDKDAAGVAGTIITVGGPMVNTVTADAIAGTDVTIDTTNNVVVKALGNRIVVAGYTAADTVTAGDLFIAGIKRQ